MGTPDFSVPTLNALVDAGHIAVVDNQIDQRSGKIGFLLRFFQLENGMRFGNLGKSDPGLVEWMCSVEADVAVAAR